MTNDKAIQKQQQKQKQKEFFIKLRNNLIRNKKYVVLWRERRIMYSQHDTISLARTKAIAMSKLYRTAIVYRITDEKIIFEFEHGRQA